MTALDGNLVDISFFRAETFLWSVHVGTTCTLVRPSPGVSPKNYFRLNNTAKGPERRDDNAGLPPFSNTHGHSSRVSSWLNHGDSHGSNSPRELRTGTSNSCPVLTCLCIDPRRHVPGMQVNRAQMVPRNLQLTESYRVSEMPGKESK